MLSIVINPLSKNTSDGNDPSIISMKSILCRNISARNNIFK